MVNENFQQIQEYFPWLFDSLLSFAVVVLVLKLTGTLFAYVVCASRHGPSEGFNVLAKGIISGFYDLLFISPKRLWAIVILAIQESLRRYVLVVFAVFVVIMLFAGWFLDVDSEHPDRLYISFVLGATNFFMLGLAVLLSAFSLPADIQNRTIYTIVTKPVRAGEIVLGRMIGFTLVGTVMLMLMGVISYFFVTRGLNHSHTVDIEAMEPVDGEPGVLSGVTSRDAYHRHEVILSADGTMQVQSAKGHTHGVRVVGEGEEKRYEIGPPQGMLQARVPVYGSLRYTTSEGEPGTGINVGDEWMYRKYIEGDSLAAAIWTFQNVTPGRFAESMTYDETAAWRKDAADRSPEEQALAEEADRKQGLPLELTLGVFRTYKGDIEERIRGEIMIVNPDPTSGLRSERMPFVSEEFSIQSIVIPRTLKARSPDGTLRDVDLYDDLSSSGQIEIWIYCAERNQYFGMAEPDLYIRAANNSFAWNFLKGYISIWLQMVIVICFGVTFSTIVSGPVAILGSFAIFMMGYFSQWILDLSNSVLFQGGSGGFGGGPIEAVIRMFTQRSIGAELDVPGEWYIQFVDKGIMWTLYAMVNVLPNFQDFDTARFVAYGFNINGHLLAQNATITFAFVLVLTTIGYFSLRARELAS